MIQVETSQVVKEPRSKYSHFTKITSGLWLAYRDFHSKFKLEYPEVDRKKYIDICHAVNTALSDKIIKESFEFRMPARLGTISIRKTKVKIKVKDGRLEKNKMIIDWGKTWEYWNQEYPGLSRKEVNAMSGKVVIYNMNDHTNGYIMRWKWDKSTAMVTNQTVYKFRPTKRNRLELGNWIKSELAENDYLLNNKYGINKIRKISTPHQEGGEAIVEQEDNKEQSN